MQNLKMSNADCLFDSDLSISLAAFISVSRLAIHAKAANNFVTFHVNGVFLDSALFLGRKVFEPVSTPLTRRHRERRTGSYLVQSRHPRMSAKETF